MLTRIILYYLHILYIENKLIIMLCHNTYILKKIYMITNINNGCFGTSEF